MFTGARRTRTNHGPPGWPVAFAAAAPLQVPEPLEGVTLGRMSILDPAGPAAAQIETLWWVLFWTATVVTLIVFALLAVAVMRSRARDRGDLGPTRLRGFNFVLIGGAVVPAVVLVATFVYSIMIVPSLDIPPAPSEDDGHLTVQAIGHKFWFEFRYPDADVVTANEMVVPVGQRVRIGVNSTDVIHSFWVPNVNGKIDMIPGQTNWFWLETSEPGLYRGVCTEFCGTQHANMAFLMRAVPEDEYAAWIENQQRPAPSPFESRRDAQAAPALARSAP